MKPVRSILVSGLALAALAAAALVPSPTTAGTPAAAIQAMLGLPAPPAQTPYIYVERKDDRVRGVIANVVKLPVEHVLNDVVLCYGAFPDWFPLQKSARYVAPIVDDKAVIYGAMEFPWPIGTRDFQAVITGGVDESREPDVYRIDFQHKPGTGNIKTMEGYWALQAYSDNSTLVVYDSTIDFDTWVPSFLLARGTRQFLPAIMQRMATRTAECPAQHQAPRG